MIRTRIHPLRRGDLLADPDRVPWLVTRFLTSRFRVEVLYRDQREAGFAALLLLSECWRQDPPGTLPADDVSLAQMAGYGSDLDRWRAARDLALYGWRPVLVRAADDATVSGGYLGHGVVARIAAGLALAETGSAKE